jgi:transcriptional antiterminator RfaH
MVSTSSLPPPLWGSNEPVASGFGPLLDACTASWFCLRAESKREHLAALNLTRRNGVEAFAPRIRLRKETRAGNVNLTTEALFPGYLFARFRYPEQARHVVSTTGVRGLVAFGGPPPRLAEDTIAHLRQHAATPALVSPVFEEGEWVRVAAGCFRGSEGRVRQSRGAQDRICVLLSILGHDVEISLPADQLVNCGDLPGQMPVALRAAPAASLARFV